MKESKIIKGVVTAVAVVVLSIPAIASADAGAELKGRTEKVSFADLNVNKEAGAEQLYRRLQQASKRVCGVEPLKISGSVKVLTQSMRCYRQTLDATVAKIDKDALTAVHEG